MAEMLPGKDVSLWIDTTTPTSYPSLGGASVECDVAIVGGGITGLLSAWQLQSEGLRVVLVEKKRLAEWTTGSTTAKLTSQHYLIYDFLTQTYGEDVARAYGRANEDGINAIESLAESLKIDCDFARRDAYVYTRQDKTIADIMAEVSASQKLGLTSSFETSTDLPFEVKAAVKFSNQAQFHPRRFLLALAQELNKGPTQIYENTKATDIKLGPLNTVETTAGEVKAKYIIEATQFPFWRPKLFEQAMWTKFSYAWGLHLTAGMQYPQGMYITTDQPMRTIRSHPYRDGEILIFGGESHKYDGDYDEAGHFNNLLTDVREKFSVDEVLYRWFAGDAMPYDRLPYIGEYPGAPNVYTVTGYSAWGLAWSMSAANLLTSQIMGRPLDWAEPFSLRRLTQ